MFYTTSKMLCQQKNNRKPKIRVQPGKTASFGIYRGFQCFEGLKKCPKMLMEAIFCPRNGPIRQNHLKHQLRSHLVDISKPQKMVLDGFSAEW
jgi:hypothetical protein